MKSILLIDDEALICAEFKRTLEGFGFQVSTAHTLETALRSTRKTQFDAILLEFNLRSERRAHPTTGNSLKLVRQFRAMDVSVPVLIFTAMEGEPYESASFEAGADEFIPKAAGIPSIVARVRAHIRRHERDLRKASAGTSSRSISRSPESTRTRRAVKASE
jgi:two-component system, OmpR family, response regulator